MRKIMTLGLATAMSLSLIAGCSATSTSTESGNTSSSGTTLRLLQNKVEVDAGLKKMAEAYKEQTGVTVEIESLGGGADMTATLKGYYQAGNMPDIFSFSGDTDWPTWEGKLADLSDSAWVSDTEAEYVVDGATYGFPTTTEAIGLTYNKAILDAAGIDPKGLTSPAAMKQAFETLESKKEELGLTAVVGYGAEASALWWSSGLHLFGTYLDEGLARDDSTYIDMLSDGGKVDDQRFAKWADMVELLIQHSDRDLLVSGTYDQQVLNFASGKYAFVTQGSWIGATMTSDNADAYTEAGNFEVGMAPYAFEDGQDTILTNSPNWWGVYKDGNVEEAKKFLEWAASNDGGQKILVEDCGFISPYSSSTFVADDPFAQTILDYTEKGKTSSWHWLSMKEGLGQNATGAVFQSFAAGDLSKEDFITTMKEVIANYYAQ